MSFDYGFSFPSFLLFLSTPSTRTYGLLSENMLRHELFILKHTLNFYISYENSSTSAKQLGNICLWYNGYGFYFISNDRIRQW
jgi:hypothetical protein